MDEPGPMIYTCTVCKKQVEGVAPGRQLCPACYDEFHQWLSNVLHSLCKEGEDPVKKLYCFPRD